MKIVACYSIKGGDGKTATAINLAYAAAQDGLRTLICDLDPQGASSYYFRVRPSTKLKADTFFTRRDRLVRNIKGSDYPRLDILPANLAYRDFDQMLAGMKKSRLRLSQLLHSLSDEYDLVVLDCPPNITILSENIFHASDQVVVPVIPTTLSQRTFSQLLGFYKESNLKRKSLLPFFSMVEQRKRMHNEVRQDMRKAYKRFLQSEVPYSVDVENMGVTREPLLVTQPRSPAALAFTQLWRELKQRSNGVSQGELKGAKDGD